MNKDKPRTYLPAKVAKALRDHVPEELSKMMRDRLREADQLFVQFDALTAEVVALKDDLNEHASLKVARNTSNKAERSAQLAISGCEEQTRNLAIERAEYRLESEKRISNILETTLAGIVRNTEWRESVLEFEADYSSDGQGHSTTVDSKPKVTEKVAT